MFKLHARFYAQMLAIGAVGLAGQALAQNEPQIEEVVTVGTQIKGVDITGTLPVSSLSAEDIAVTGAADGEDLIRSIPQIGSVGFTESRSSNTGVNSARGDVASINLRSIGDGNTLTLLNGRRLVNHPITQTQTAPIGGTGIPITTVNINALPIAGLQGVEILRDGAGALYGSDAVAGIVNYNTLKDGEKGNFSVRYGNERGTEREDLTLNAFKSFEFNDGATFFSFSVSFDEKQGISTAENSFTATEDQRARLPAIFDRADNADNRTQLEILPLINVPGIGNLQLRPAVVVSDDGPIPYLV